MVYCFFEPRRPIDEMRRPLPPTGYVLVGADSKSKEGATMTEGTLETIGCDLGDKQAEIFILRADGTNDRAKPVKLTRAGVRSFFSV